MYKDLTWSVFVWYTMFDLFETFRQKLTMHVYFRFASKTHQRAKYKRVEA